MARFTTNDLTDNECLALVYVQMLCTKGDAAKAKFAAQWKQGMEMMDRERVSAHERKKRLAKGLAGLREKGIIDCERDGEGDLVPTVYHEEMIEAPAARLIATDFN